MSTVSQGEFEWDDAKASANERKHGVSFDEAATAFLDLRALVIGDPQQHDSRFVLIGMSRRVRILYVVHAQVVVHHGSERTRIISARIAVDREALQYTLGDAT